MDRGTRFGCPVVRKRKVRVSGRYKVDPIYGGSEYETAAALGSCCDIDSLPPSIHRAKGFLHFLDGGYLLNYAIGRTDLEDARTNRTQLAFIGPGG